MFNAHKGFPLLLNLPTCRSGVFPLRQERQCLFKKWDGKIVHSAKIKQIKYYINLTLKSKKLHCPKATTVCKAAQWLKHCVSSAKVVGSIPRKHTY